MTAPSHFIGSIAELETIYKDPAEPALVKETDYVTPEYGRMIAASPFVALATVGPEGLDCSPRGDLAGFVRVHDTRTLMLPDRRGNNRVDSLRNIVRDPRVGLLFLIPGSGSTLRVNGRARLSTDPALLDSFVMEGKAPRSVIVVTAESVYTQCPKALVRSRLWDPSLHLDESSLPSSGTIMKSLQQGFDGDAYDREYPQRLKETIY